MSIILSVRIPTVLATWGYATATNAEQEKLLNTVCTTEKRIEAGLAVMEAQRQQNLRLRETGLWAKCHITPWGNDLLVQPMLSVQMEMINKARVSLAAQQQQQTTTAAESQTPSKPA